MSRVSFICLFLDVPGPGIAWYKRHKKARPEGKGQLFYPEGIGLHEKVRRPVIDCHWCRVMFSLWMMLLIAISAFWILLSGALTHWQTESISNPRYSRQVLGGWNFHVRGGRLVDCTKPETHKPAAGIRLCYDARPAENRRGLLILHQIF